VTPSAQVVLSGETFDVSVETLAADGKPVSKELTLTVFRKTKQKSHPILSQIPWLADKQPVLSAEVKITGLAYSEEQAAAAFDVAKEHGSEDRISYIIWDASTIPFDDGEVALVVCVGPSLVHLKNRATVFKEMHRILQPGGVGFAGGRYLPWPQERK